MSRVSLAIARISLEAARAAASQLGIEVSVAVVDGGGHLVLLERMDGAPLASVETSLVKARTSVMFGAPTRVFPFDQPVATALVGGVGFPVGLFPGGVPVLREGVPMMAIGVGGSTAENDDVCAVAAADAVHVALTDGSA